MVNCWSLIQPSFLPFQLNLQVTCSLQLLVTPCTPRLTDLWHACPKWHGAIPAVPMFLFDLPTSVYCEEHVETVYELPLLPNNTARATVLHKSVAARSADWIFITGASTWRWLGEYVTLDKTFYCLVFKQEVAAAPWTSTSSFLSHFSVKDFIRNIIIILQ